VRAIASGLVSTVAGSGVAGHQDGPVGEARFSSPSDVAVDGSGTIYVADTNNHCIRTIHGDMEQEPLAGQPAIPGLQDGPATAAKLQGPMGVTLDSAGDVFVADTGNDFIRVIRQ